MQVKNYVSRIAENGSVYLAESGSFRADGRKIYNNPDLLAWFFGDSIGIRAAAEEHLYVACLDAQYHIVGCFEGSHGSVNASMFPVREIFQKALMIGAVYIALSHNHPSGVLSPSQADREATDRIKAAGDLLGVPVLDHVIVGANNPGRYSFRENGGL